jgi:hypothetical protein
MAAGTSAPTLDYPIDGHIGYDITKTYLSASATITVPWPCKPGETVRTTNNGVYIFARAESEVSAGNVVIFGPFGDSAAGFTASGPVPPHCAPITTTYVQTTVGPQMIGVAQVNIPSANWGWIALNGINLQVWTSATNPHLPLFTSGTAGQLSTTTVSQCLIQGIYIYTSATSTSFPLASVVFPHLQFSNPI